MKHISYLLLGILLLFVACTDNIDEQPQNQTPRLHSISCPVGRYTIATNSMIDVAFSVEDKKALFNYATSTDGCQVELRLANNLSSAPTQVSLLRVRQDDTAPGSYYAAIVDNGSGKIYSIEVCLVIKLDMGEIVKSNPVKITNCPTGLPILYIDTPNRQSVASKEEWVEHSTFTLDGMGRFEDMDGVEVAIRGRGNSTWGYPKRPYALKFTEKQKVMGMPKHKRWVLLANYMDRTLLRNRVAFFLASQTSLAWTPKCEYVELILNGKHLGQYLLCEQVRVDNDRVAITEMTTNDNSGESVTGGYMLELDFHYDNVWQWWTSHGVPFSVKYPDEEDLTSEQLSWIKGHIRDVENALYGDNFRDEHYGYKRYIDEVSFVDYWLIYEICVNHELANPGSVYLTKDRNGEITAGPVWDFDWGTFSYNASPAAQWGLFMTHAWWYRRLFEDEDFKALASERWQELKPKFMEVFDFIEQERDYIEESWHTNFSIWSINTTTNGDEHLSFDDAVDRMIDITRERIEIIDSAL